MRPRENSPPGMNTIPGSAAKANSPQSQRRRRKDLAAVNRREFIRGNKAIGAERIDVGVRAAGGQVMYVFRPIDPQRRVNGRVDVLDTRLLVVVPPGIDALGA